jgi:hypothetical protein
MDRPDRGDAMGISSTRIIEDDFSTSALQACWTPWTTGGGVVEPMPDALRLRLPAPSTAAYADAQITDFAGLPRHTFPWRPPLRMTVRAAASGPAQSLIGTAGFGFWNDPFVPNRRELPRLPRAAWFFFGGPRSNMALAQGVPGNGWKAATFDAQRALFYGLLPLALPGMLLMRIPALYRALWPVGQRAIGVTEAALPGDLLATPHEYALTWRRDSVTFQVDGHLVLDSPTSPRGPLGFIAWMDNQYAVVTPQGQFGWGVAAGSEQWLVLEYIRIEPL